MADRPDPMAPYQVEAVGRPMPDGTRRVRLRFGVGRGVFARHAALTLEPHQAWVLADLLVRYTGSPRADSSVADSSVAEHETDA